MIVSEDGTVTGSVDVSRLDQVEAKTDEAKAQLEALKAEHQAGREQAEAAAQRLAEQAAAANPLVDEAPQDQRDAQGKSTGANESQGLQQAQKSADQKTADDKPTARRQSASNKE